MAEAPGDNDVENGDDEVEFIALPSIDLSSFHADELRLVAQFSGHFPEADFSDIVIPKIDRSCFNESAGSRKQTYSNRGNRNKQHSNRGFELRSEANADADAAANSGAIVPFTSRASASASASASTSSAIVLKETHNIQGVAQANGSNMQISVVETSSTRIGDATSGGGAFRAKGMGLPNLGGNRRVLTRSSTMTIIQTNIHSERNGGGALPLGRRHSERILRRRHAEEQQALGSEGEGNGASRLGRRHSQRILRRRLAGEQALLCENSLEVDASGGAILPLMSLENDRDGGLAVEPVSGSENSLGIDTKGGEFLPIVGDENGQDRGLPGNEIPRFENSLGIIRSSHDKSLPPANLGKDSRHDFTGVLDKRSVTNPPEQPVFATGLDNPVAQEGQRFENGNGPSRDQMVKRERGTEGLAGGERPLTSTSISSIEPGQYEGGWECKEILAKRRRIGDGDMVALFEIMQGRWAGEEKTIKIVDAVGFPKGWTVELSLSRKLGRTLFVYRNWKSPEGMLFSSFKGASTELLSSIGVGGGGDAQSSPAVPGLTSLSDCKKNIATDHHPRDGGAGGTSDRNGNDCEFVAKNSSKLSEEASVEKDLSGSRERSETSLLERGSDEQLKVDSGRIKDAARYSTVTGKPSGKDDKCACHGDINRYLECHGDVKRYLLKFCRQAVQDSTHVKEGRLSTLLKLHNVVQSSSDVEQSNRLSTLLKLHRHVKQEDKHYKHSRRCRCNVCGKQLASEALLVGHRVILGHPRIVKATTGTTFPDISSVDGFQASGIPRSGWESLGHPSWTSNNADRKRKGAKMSTTSRKKLSNFHKADAPSVEDEIAGKIKDCSGVMACRICDRVFSRRSQYVSHLTAHETKTVMKGLLNSTPPINFAPRPLGNLIDLKPSKPETARVLGLGNLKPPGPETGREPGLGNLKPPTLISNRQLGFQVSQNASKSPFWRLLDVPRSESGSKLP